MGIKNGIKKIFNQFGYEIYKKHPIKKNYPDFAEIENPLLFNSLANLEELYQDEKNLNYNYFSAERISFFKELLIFCKSKNIAFENKTIADIGCGIGNLLKIILESFPDTKNKMVGYEYSANAVLKAKEFATGISFKQLDIYEKCDDKYDIIFCTEVLEHLLYPEKTMLNIKHMLNNKGNLIVTIPNGRLDSWQGHINFWSPESWGIFIKNIFYHDEIIIDTFQQDSIISVIKLIN